MKHVYYWQINNLLIQQYLLFLICKTSLLCMYNSLNSDIWEEIGFMSVNNMINNYIIDLEKLESNMRLKVVQIMNSVQNSNQYLTLHFSIFLGFQYKHYQSVWSILFKRNARILSNYKKLQQPHFNQPVLSFCRCRISSGVWQPSYNNENGNNWTHVHFYRLVENILRW